MRNIIKIFVLFVIISLLIIIVNIFWNQFNRELVVMRSQSVYNSLNTSDTQIVENEKYYAEVSKLSSETFMDERVNQYIDMMVEEFSKEANSIDKKIKRYDRAVLTNCIDSVKVNDYIYSIKITTNIKKSEAQNYDTIIKTFNYNSNDEKEIILDDIFKEDYKTKVEGNLNEQYMLTEKNIIFYNGLAETNISYNSLKEYVKQNTLNSYNLDITQEEFDNLFKNIVDPSKKMIAITFDDGPHKVNTDKILDTLKSYNARATFFMLGQNVNLYPDVVKRVYEQGSEIGIHTWNHPQLTKLSQENITSQIQSTSDAVYNITGYRPKLVRPPYGALNDNVKTTLKDYSLILWNIDSLDWKSRDENKIVPLVMNQVQDGDIILLHDIHSTTVPAAEKIITNLYESGYQLVTVSELIEAKGYDTTQVQVFYSGRQ